MSKLQKGLERFEAHYRQRLGAVSRKTSRDGEIQEYHYFHNDKLRPRNGPRILSHGMPTEDVVVLTHGLSDSPFYLEAIARRFYQEGCNVILPLLPAHGLLNPDKAMEDELMDRKWKACLDNAVKTAHAFMREGGRISLGGFSTGGALSLNKILRDEKAVNGGLFLFAAALEIGSLQQTLGRLNFLQTITRITDGVVHGIGPNPYKYPELPSFAGMELIQVIHENNQLLEDRGFAHPVFAAHSVHDETVRMEGVAEFLKNYATRGVSILLSGNVEHSSLPLREDIELDISSAPEGERLAAPRGNPHFEWMMDAVIHFFNREVRLQKS